MITQIRTSLKEYSETFKIRFNSLSQQNQLIVKIVAVCFSSLALIGILRVVYRRYTFQVPSDTTSITPIVIKQDPKEGQKNSDNKNSNSENDNSENQTIFPVLVSPKAKKNENEFDASLREEFRSLFNDLDSMSGNDTTVLNQVKAEAANNTISDKKRELIQALLNLFAKHKSHIDTQNDLLLDSYDKWVVTTLKEIAMITLKDKVIPLPVEMPIEKGKVTDETLVVESKDKEPIDKEPIKQPEVVIATSETLTQTTEDIVNSSEVQSKDVVPKETPEISTLPADTSSKASPSIQELTTDETPKNAPTGEVLEKTDPLNEKEEIVEKQGNDSLTPPPIDKGVEPLELKKSQLDTIPECITPQKLTSIDTEKADTTSIIDEKEEEFVQFLNKIEERISNEPKFFKNLIVKKADEETKKLILECQARLELLEKKYEELGYPGIINKLHTNKHPDDSVRKNLARVDKIRIIANIPKTYTTMGSLRFALKHVTSEKVSIGAVTKSPKLVNVGQMEMKLSKAIRFWKEWSYAINILSRLQENLFDKDETNKLRRLKEVYDAYQQNKDNMKKQSTPKKDVPSKVDSNFKKKKPPVAENSSEV
ncbi:MAG: hypothetical protein H0W88_03300 [Parachlamydiaceae bacterium]|nr:hypothetical protein [Parachlamydiaceae bacterium]